MMKTPLVEDLFEKLRQYMPDWCLEEREAAYREFFYFRQRAEKKERDWLAEYGSKVEAWETVEDLQNEIFRLKQEIENAKETKKDNLAVHRGRRVTTK
jgi:hypothetical protein